MTPKLGVTGASAIGIGAIVGGGVMVLAGTAFRSTGPGAILAFALNGVVALLTVFSFAELGAMFPENGGVYVYARKVLGVRAAFGVGWVMWFAYIVAGVLYALGFAEYALASLGALWPGTAPPWLTSRAAAVATALFAAGYYTIRLLRQVSGGGNWATWGKVIVFGLLILAGFWGLGAREDAAVANGIQPFLPGGTMGLIQAMGFTFIALQGFEIIGTVGGEVKNPSCTIPRAMFISLGAALVIYIPLLFVVSTAGVPEGDSIQAMSQRDPATVFAKAVGNYLGPVGFWLVMLAAVLSTLSALQANLMAASRIAFKMANDRTLPRILSAIHPKNKTPVAALYATSLALATILFMVPDLASAGAAASLIFLLCFCLGHVICLLARLRTSEAPEFRSPWFPLVPILGGGLCLALAAFQGISVPAAGGIALVWSGLGVLLYFGLFSTRAQMVDESLVASDPELLRLRGESPIVLVPIANPERAAALVSIASTLAPAEVGRVMLATVVDPSTDTHGDPITVAQEALGAGVRASLNNNHEPLALLSISERRWGEIERIARQYRCHGVLLGGAHLTPERIEELEDFVHAVDSYVSFLFSGQNWSLKQCQRIVVPVGGRGAHQALRARVLGGLQRQKDRHVLWLQVLPKDTQERAAASAKSLLGQLAEDSTTGDSEVEVLLGDNFQHALLDVLQPSDLLLLGLAQDNGRKTFGAMIPTLVAASPCPTLVLARGDDGVGSSLGRLELPSSWTQRLGSAKPSPAGR